MQLHVHFMFCKSQAFYRDTIFYDTRLAFHHCGNQADILCIRHDLTMLRKDLKLVKALGFLMTSGGLGDGTKGKYLYMFIY